MATTRTGTKPEERKNHARRTGAPTTRRMGARTRSPGHAAAKQTRRETTQETEDQKTRPLEVLLEPLGGLEINHCLNRFWRTPKWSPNGPPEAPKGDKIVKIVKPQSERRTQIAVKTRRKKEPTTRPYSKTHGSAATRCPKPTRDAKKTQLISRVRADYM